MSQILRCTTGTINFPDWLHVTAAKVSAPSTIVWEDWFDSPVTNFNFIIPGLDPDQYIVNFYESPDNVSVGAIRLSLLANALTNEFDTEKKYYTCGAGGAGDPSNGDTQIIDPYLTNKNITGCFKESFRYIIRGSEWERSTTSTAEDTIDILSPSLAFSDGEVFVVEIKYKVGTISSPARGFYAGRVNVSASTYTCLVADKNKLHRLVGTATTQTVTLPPLSSLSEDDMFVLSNACGGTPVQVKVLFSGSDSLFYNGFRTSVVPTTFFQEFWVDRGDMLMFAKVGAYYELTLPYKGNNVGQRFMGIFKDYPNTIIQDGQVGADALDGDIYPKLWFWINNMLPATHKVVDPNVTLTTYTHPPDKVGLFVLHPTLKKFRTGNWSNMTDKGLNNMRVYNSDAKRPYDYPGGREYPKVLSHRHLTVRQGSVTNGAGLSANATVAQQNETGSVGDFKYTLVGITTDANLGKSGTPVDNNGASIANDDNVVNNIGGVSLIYF